jgi:polyisoprenoid-binding protein YceI
MENRTSWVIDPTHSEVSFKVKHLMISNVKGIFKDFEAQVATVGNDFSTADINFTLKPASIDTGSPDRDAHLKSADFFDVENFAEMKFKANSFVSKDDENYTLEGDLTIKGVSRSVKLDVEFGGLVTDPWGNEKAGFTINGKINRKDWGLNWNAALEAGGVLVGEEVRISIELELLKLKS